MMITTKLFSVLIFMVCFVDTEGWFFSYKPKNIQVDFWLYTKNGNSKTTITTSNLPSKFINGAKTVFLIHGWKDNGDTKAWIEMKEELLKLSESLNVVIVNWKDGASKWYAQSAQNTRTVGKKTGDIIKAIKENKGVAYSNFHIVGHSLGAHCGGFTGQRIIALTGDKIGRISGLDPAGYKFSGQGANEGLSIGDADFVDAIHTDDGLLLALSFGYKKGKTLGHVDFYPNGGQYQPGCSFYTVGCSHYRAVYYFINSINTCQYKSHVCLFFDGVASSNVKAKMGYHSSTSLRGKYCLETSATKPFCGI